MSHHTSFSARRCSKLTVLLTFTSFIQQKVSACRMNSFAFMLSNHNLISPEHLSSHFHGYSQTIALLNHLPPLHHQKQPMFQTLRATFLLPTIGTPTSIKFSSSLLSLKERPYLTQNSDTRGKRMYDITTNNKMTGEQIGNIKKSG